MAARQNGRVGAVMKGFTEALRGANGGYELNRVVGFVGGFSYIVGAHVFVAWDLAQGSTFDLVAYCAAFPAGLAVAATGSAAAVAIKDRNVAKAKGEAKSGSE